MEEKNRVITTATKNNCFGSIPPWCNSDGTYKTDREIELLGKGWDYKTWDAYFRAIEGNQKEESIAQAIQIENISAKDCVELLYSCAVSDEYSHLHSAINHCLTMLPKRQKEIVHMTYWDRKSQYEIAKALNISRTTVQQALEDGRKKLKKMLVNKELQSFTSQLRCIAS